jgi:hypothetical protein
LPECVDLVGTEPLGELRIEALLHLLAVFLASDTVTWLTGDSIVLDCGVMCRVCA